MIDWNSIPEALWPHVANGLEPLEQSKTQWLVCAPFTDSNKVYVNPATGQFDVKDEPQFKGNGIHWQTFSAKTYRDNMTPALRRELGALRGMPPAMFKHPSVGHDGKHFTIAHITEKTLVRTIKRLTKIKGKHKLFASKGTHPYLYGADELAIAPAGCEVWLCESEWDALAIRFVCDLLDTPIVAVSTGGASNIKPEWVELIRSKRPSVVNIAYDNDDAGQQGERKAFAALTQSGVSCRVLRPDADWPEGWDLAKFIRWGFANDVDVSVMLAALRDRLRESPRVTPGKESSTDTTPSQELDPADCPTFDEVRETFAKHIRVCNETELALTVVLAVALSRTVPGDPLWIYLVAASGGGKTTLLKALAGSTHTMILSRVTPKTLVSGQRGDSDPSLLPKLNHKVGVWLEFTEILSMHTNDRDEIFALLRSAYDGEISRHYGNGAARHYIDLNFPMLMACTPAIHGCRTALMGERCMKLCMKHTGNPLETVLAAIRGSGHEDKAAAELREVVGRFLSQRVEVASLPRVSPTIEIRIAALAQLIGMLRAQVDREIWGDRDMKYRPVTEIGTRLAKQLVKLGRMLAVVLGKTEVNTEVYSIVERVARDTATGFSLEIVKAIADAGGSATRDSIRETLGLPMTSLGEKLSDLAALGVVVKLPGAGPTAKGAKRPSDLWSISEATKTLWNKAQPWGSGMKTDFGPPKRDTSRSFLIKRVGRKKKKKEERKGSNTGT